MEEETVESAHAYTLDEMAELCFEVEQFKLSGRSRLDRYTYAELCRLCNGIGAEWMPKIMRNLLTALSPFAEPAAVIHDVEYFEGGAERERGMADLQFRDNIVITAKKCYRWCHPLRYLAMVRAECFYLLLRLFGKVAWRGEEKDRVEHQ